MPSTRLQSLRMQLVDVVEMPLSGRLDMLGQHRHTVLVAVAVAYHDLIVDKVNVFYP